MWIFMSNSFLSIVQDKNDRTKLLVRARVKGDIENVFPDANVYSEAGSDYKFRAKIDAVEVARAICFQVADIDYTNFKNSVPDKQRARAYTRVWTDMCDYQDDLYPEDKEYKWDSYLRQKYGDIAVNNVKDNGYWSPYSDNYDRRTGAAKPVSLAKPDYYKNAGAWSGYPKSARETYDDYEAANNSIMAELAKLDPDYVDYTEELIRDNGE